MIILGTNSIKDTGFNVANSLRFNSGSSDNLSRTKGTSDSTTKGTYSFWFKLSKTTGLTLIENGTAAADRAIVYIASDSTLKIFSKIGNSTKLDLNPNRVFRDTSAWYHLVIAIDTTDGTAGDRVKVYVNGVRETSFATATYPDQNDALRFFTSSEIEEIGIDFENGGLFDGYMCEVVKVDGSQLAPTSFGEFDEDSGIWKPIDVSGLTFGTNGFYLEFKESGTSQNASGLGADTSGNTNHFAVNNLTAIDQSTDTCTNNFATLNPLALRNNPSAYYVTFSDGNLKLVGNDATNNGNAFSTIGFNSGKWYCEVKVLSVEGSLYPIIGVITENSISNGSGNNGIIGQVTSDTVGYANDGEKVIAGTESSYGDTYTDNDIIGIAIDCDNGAVYFSKNGTFQASGNPTSGASKTNAAMTFTAGANYFFGVSAYKSTSDVEFNFGSPPYAISSGNTDGNGYGNFEYAVPSGYYALNTKNLAEYG